MFIFFFYYCFSLQRRGAPNVKARYKGAKLTKKLDLTHDKRAKNRIMVTFLSIFVHFCIIRIETIAN